MMANKSSRREAGSGSIRQRPDGTWEARYTNGRDPQTGKIIRRSIYGKTQKEVAVKLRQVTADIDANVYVEPCTTPYGEWLDTWLAEYLAGHSPLTISAYEGNCRNYIKPGLGKLRLDAVTPEAVQKFINRLPSQGLSAKTIRNIHGVIHRSLEQAVRLGYIRANPAAVCNLPKAARAQIVPMTDEEVAKFLAALQDPEQPFAVLFTVALFTWMRQGELLGLQWRDIDFRRGTILVQRQLMKLKGKNNGYTFTTPKDNDSRLIKPAAYVMELLRRHRQDQAQLAIAADCAWNNPDDLVFTNAFGGHLTHVTVYKAFKRLVTELGIPNKRFHDMRHTFAVISLENGDDVKTVQNNLGHATAAFTLDVYGHVNDRMRNESAQRMDRYIHSLRNDQKKD